MLVAFLVPLISVVLLGCGGGDVPTSNRTPLSASSTAVGSAAHTGTDPDAVSTTGLPTTSPLRQPSRSSIVPSGPSTPSEPGPAPSDTLGTDQASGRPDVGSTSDTPTTALFELAPTAADVARAFDTVASALAPVAVFAPTVLPAGTTLAAGWWPLLERAEPRAGSDENTPNPRIRGEGPEPEAQLLLQTPAGPVLFLENFRGDLGDVTGTDVGKVGGIGLTRYELTGGTLVQWSYQGRWYGVFGRGRAAGIVTPIAANVLLLQDE